MKRFIVYLFIIFFILLAPLTVITYNLKRTYFDLKFCQTKFTENGFYTAITDLISNSLGSGINLNIGGNFLLGTEDIKDIVEAVITPDWLGEQSNAIMTGTFYLFDLHKDPRQAQIIIDLSAKKVQTEQLLRDKINEKITNLPSCDQADVNNFINKTSETNPICLPPGLDPDQFIQQNNLDPAALMTNLPDRLNLIEYLANGFALQKKENFESRAEVFWRNIETIRNIFKYLNYIYLSSLILLPLSIILIILLSLPHLKVILRRLGLALFFPAIFLFLISLAPNITAEVFFNKLNIFQTNLSIEPNESMQKLIYSLLVSFYRPLLWQSLVAFVLALILIIISCIIKKKHVQINNPS